MRRPPRFQRGAALIALAAVLVIAILVGIVKMVDAALGQTTTSRNRNADVLQQAKQALLGYVAKEALNLANSTPGRLPCPESPSIAGDPNEGVMAGNCAPTYPTDKTVGRLPWRTLGIEKLVDAAAEPLWYAVSPNWVRTAASEPLLNPATPGQLSVDGIGDVVAVIIAPGSPLIANPNTAQAAAGCAAVNQSRNDHAHDPAEAAYPDYRNYLECQNATFAPDLTFGSSVVDNAVNAVLNDQLVYVTAGDILNAIQGPVAERIQRTVAPLFSEHAAKWIAASGARFLPYSVPFTSAPETNTATCGTVGTREGFLPTDVIGATACASAWQDFAISGTQNSVFNASCSGTPVTCTFSYYRLNAVGAALDIVLKILGLYGNVVGTGTITTTITANAPNAAVTFRDPLENSSITVNPSFGYTLSLTPRTTGEVALRIDVTVTSGTNNLCTSLVGLVCNLLPGLLASPNTVTVTFPQLSDATVQGLQLLPAVYSSGGTLNLLSPSAGDPHFWFFENEWYRYAYYAVAPQVSAARSGGYLTVSGLPAANGNPDDKQFVLAVTGPAVRGQDARPSNSVGQYLEGENASTGNNTFAYHVFGASGNDRIATCPFIAGAASLCD